MRKITLFLAVLGAFSLVGCEKKGDKGDQGDPGPGQITVYNGSITSNTQIISVAALTSNSLVSVYVGAGGEWSELPYFMPGAGINTYYISENYVVTIYNAQTAAATSYKIVVINDVSTSGISRIYK